MPHKIPSVNMQEAINKYDTLLFDAFGVLVNADGVIEYAIELIDHLNNIGKSYYVLTNGSKFTLEDTSKSYLSRGLEISPDKIISSGSLMLDWFQENQLQQASCYVLGPEPSLKLVAECGGRVVARDETDFEVLVITNQDGFQFPEQVNHAISCVFERIESGKPIRLLMPNPDVIYPAGQNQFGVTSAAIGAMIEAALSTRFYGQAFEFEKLGKPFSPIFAKAEQLSGSKNMLMIGDQIPTDILGARHYGIDSALTTTGITNVDQFAFTEELSPSYILHSLQI